MPARNQRNTRTLFFAGALLLILTPFAAVGGECAAAGKESRHAGHLCVGIHAHAGFDFSGSDAKAIEIADAVMDAMGGCAAWDATRCVMWNFFGRRFHVWDKWSGDIRVESADMVVTMNLHSGDGHVWTEGVEMTDPDDIAKALDNTRAAWINDSYWIFMPWKLKDSGVTLTYTGVGETTKGEPADVLELTFKNVGLTPENMYRVYVDRETRLVVQWDYYETASDEEVAMATPWENWRRYGGILISSGRGRGDLTHIAVADSLPPGTFDSPQPFARPGDVE